jgi:hypothetical protein
MGAAMTVQSTPTTLAVSQGCQVRSRSPALDIS